MTARPTILMACSSDWVSPSRLPAVLVAGGARVVAFSAPGYPLTATRFVDEVIAAPAALDAYVDALRDHLRTTRYDWILVADDPLLVALRARAAAGEGWTRGVLPIADDHPWAAIVASKDDLAALGSAAGLPIPASRRCETAADAARAADELGFPLVLKQSEGFAGLGVRLVATRDQLDAAWAEIGGGVVVAQRFVEGPIGNSVFLMARGRPICWMSAYKVRTFPGPFGPSSARRFMTHDDVAPLLARIGELTGYHGFGALDWVLGPDRRLHIIELNARPVPAIHMSRRAGVDFARAVRELLSGVPVHVQAPPPPSPDAPVHPMFPEDVYRGAVENNLDLRQLLPRRGIPSDVPWRDPPLLAYHVRTLYRAARTFKR
jgi:glutathione synthase/RimK-type ligase-like ATP-grasp enzyme